MRFQSVFSPGVPEGPSRGRDGATYVPSSFGSKFTTQGPQFSARAVFESKRARLLAERESLYRCTRHDGKLYDWQGRACPPGLLSTQPLIGAALPTSYVPLDLRRPNDPYRLPKLVVSAFTALVFGEGMFPEIKVAGDAKTQDFARELARAQGLAEEMTLARNVGGSTGTVGLSWRFCDGLPRVAVWRPQYLHVHEWEDFERLVPAHVTRLAQVERRVRLRDGREAPMLFWQRQDWTPEADVFYFEEPVDPKGEPDWRVEREEPHGDGFCHFVWIRNLRDTDESSIDGLPDYDGLPDCFDALDVLSSVVTRGGVLNLDPTLVVKADVQQVNRYGLRKGSDNAIVLDANTAGSDAKYLELAGTSISAGRELIKDRRAHALEVSQCVVPDPNQIAAAGTSAAGLRLVYRPMLSQANLMRGAYGRGIEQILGQQIESARNLLRVSVDVPETVESDPASGEQEISDPEGSSPIDPNDPTADRRGDPDETNPADEPRRAALALSPRVVEEELTDDAMGALTGETIITFEEREPGEGGDVELVWPSYFEPTPADRQQEATTISVLSGGKPGLSHRTCVEMASKLAGVDPIEEWRRVQEQVAREKATEGGMFPPTGGDLPPLSAAAPQDGGDPPPDGQEVVPEDEAREDGSATPEPAVVEPGAEPGPAQVFKLAPEFVPNGAQIQAAVTIVQQVVAGDLPRDAGLGLLEVMFNLSPQAALKIMGSAGNEKPADPPAPLPPA